MKKDNFPELPEKGFEEAKDLLKKFTDALVLSAEQKISDLYTDWLPHIETDSWQNFQQQCLEELKNYGESKKIHSYDWKEIRQVILQENREEIIKDLNQDHLNKIEELEKRIETIKGLIR